MIVQRLPEFPLFFSKNLRQHIRPAVAVCRRLGLRPESFALDRADQLFGFLQEQFHFDAVPSAAGVLDVF